MARKDSPIKIELPTAADDRPAWSKVGIIGAAGFVIGMAWPHFAGVHFGPSPPNDAHVAADSSADPAASAAVDGPAGSASAPAPSASGAAEASPANRELVVVGPGKITKCSDAKDKKIDDCGELQFDPIALPKVKDLAKCTSAMGLEGKLSIGFEVDFKAKEVHVVKGKKTTLPTSTVQGVLQCAAKDFANVALDDVPHKHRRYTLFYSATFYPPGKHPDDDKSDKPKDDAEDPAGTTTSETTAQGSATVSWDRAPIRKEPKTGDVVTHAVKGTHVKILAKQNDWYRVEVGSNTGWVYRGALGL
jgi:SH3 domain-containing protein